MLLHHPITYTLHVEASLFQVHANSLRKLPTLGLPRLFYLSLSKGVAFPKVLSSLQRSISSLQSERVPKQDEVSAGEP